MTRCPGVGFTVFGEAERDEETEGWNADETVKPMKIVGNNPDTAGQFSIGMRTTGSHEKFMLANTKSVDRVAAVGSCNWLRSPFATRRFSCCGAAKRAPVTR
jgi:hypothetical protein